MADPARTPQASAAQGLTRAPRGTGRLRTHEGPPHRNRCDGPSVICMTVLQKA
ncbi:hypothetical protein BN2537_7135 [Streptomyces venezuelae]|nr:hypothetical protein BN2537_7135 [Streptomyces venezuelae]